MWGANRVSGTCTAPVPLGKASHNPHLTYLAFLLWNIWKHRNNAVFREKSIQPLEVIYQTNLQVEEWSSSNSIQINPPTQTTTCQIYQWRPPRGDALKCNSNASWSTHGNHAALGVVVRDSNGYLLSGMSKRILAPSPMVAEALALREAMLLASNLQWPKCLFESDNLSLIKACRQEIQIGEIKGIIRDIIALKPNFQHCGFLWTNRKGNEVAHLVATSTLHGSIPPNWVVNPHPALRGLLQQEALQANYLPP
ncbi:Ribonuclease H-like superfamily [Sesbania bispinosa]|nr:Ribonuclease H-like superfamily [Sesbania bispinosa]